MARHNAPGYLAWIGVRPARRTDLVAVPQVRVREAGLEGDHRARPGKRAVTLIQAEHLPVISSLCGRKATYGLLRRNLGVSGINLAALRGRDLRLGTVLLRITGPCAPCSRMEEALGPGGYSAMRQHGGWCAEVVTPGAIALGDTLVPE